MNELGRLEDLPADYRDALARQNLVPLWPALRTLMPAGQPQPATRATHWPKQTPAARQDTRTSSFAIERRTSQPSCSSLTNRRFTANWVCMRTAAEE
jgi:hypothetical protein